MKLSPRIIRTGIALLFMMIIYSCEQKKPAIPDNPKYSTEVENRIAHVINNLQVETSTDATFDSDSLYNRMRYYHTPGLSIAVINDGKLEWARGFGVKDQGSADSVDIHTVFEAGSVSKPVFALGVMKLKEKGSIDLDKDVNEYLKSWKVPANKDWQPVLTLRQLLSHTAGTTVHGFPGYLKTEKIPSLPEILNGAYPANTPVVRVNILPGTAFRYSGGGITIAQLSIMDHLGKTFPQIMQEELFQPLQLKYSTYEQPLPSEKETNATTAFPWKGNPIAGRFHVYPEMAAAGLWTNPSELAAIVLEIQKSLRGGSTLFKKETIDEMLTPQKVANHVGIGFFLQSKGDSSRFGHDGWDEGFVTTLLAYKKRGQGAIIMVNSNEGYSIMNEILNAIAIEYHWPDFLPNRVKAETSGQQADFRNYAGSYFNSENSEIKIFLQNNELQLSYENQHPIPLVLSTEKYFFSPALNFKIYFNPKNELRFEQNGSSHVFKRK